ncbi:PQQ-binding-like beta-propeller repeat protein [Halomontanus rarus]|uniref:PQQ-binding-like beta-propeller repeat protein n=1 Tax=Halomontanus rarus TaxID=3034020 RepID=UPI0023E8E574|nr:PQQ-binding-like beta-propeller repeat protein [Halovivax sp. TS33]
MAGPPHSRRSRSGDGRQTRRSILRRVGAVGTVGLGGLAGCVSLQPPQTYDLTQDGFDPEILPYDETYPPDDEVTMFRGGLRRLGYYPDRTVPDAVTVDWQVPINEVGHTAAKSTPRPTPDGETILIPADTGRVHAFSPEGEERWTAQTKAVYLGIHGTPAIAHGVAYIGGYDGRLYAFDVETGEEVWRTVRLGGAIAIGSSPAYWNGILYVVAEYSDPDAGTMWAVDAETGQPLWSDDRLWGMPHPSAAIDPEHERMITASNDGVCYCWEFPSLEFAWEFQTGGEIKGTTPLYDGSVFLGSWDDSFYRVSLEDGTEEWSFETGDIVMSNAAIDPDAGVVYVGSSDRYVYALDTDTGERVWSANVGGSVIGSLIVTAETVLVGSYDSHLYALDKETGDERWRVANQGHVTSGAIPHDGRIYYAERGVFSNYWDDDEETILETPGNAYCLVPDK